jgi:hypothetical protein
LKIFSSCPQIFSHVTASRVRTSLEDGQAWEPVYSFPPLRAWEDRGILKNTELDIPLPASINDGSVTMDPGEKAKRRREMKHCNILRSSDSQQIINQNHPHGWAERQGELVNFLKTDS